KTDPAKNGGHLSFFGVSSSSFLTRSSPESSSAFGAAKSGANTKGARKYLRGVSLSTRPDEGQTWLTPRRAASIS
ncbi:unnamed protein product, partial [Amoebophrya sp. A25]